MVPILLTLKFTQLKNLFKFFGGAISRSDDMFCFIGNKNILSMFISSTYEFTSGQLEKKQK
jgi:hypothetical protein